MKLFKKILEILGYAVAVVMIGLVVIALFLGAMFRMEDCVANNSTSYCVMTQKNFVFWDIVNPLKKDEK